MPLFSLSSSVLFFFLPLSSSPSLCSLSPTTLYTAPASFSDLKLVAAPPPSFSFPSTAPSPLPPPPPPSLPPVPSPSSAVLGE
eukprot:scaffold28278_cov26-Tisochrysis_lutea.AAC.2